MKLIKNIVICIALITKSLLMAHYQNAVLRRVQKLLPENPVILEAGGRFGEDTKNMKHIWPGATMHVFEPVPSSFEIMKKNVVGLSDVFCYPYALADYEGKTQMYTNENNPGAASIGYPVEWNKHEFDTDHPIQVPCTTINAWAARNNIEKIDFMWLDMEGYELYALQYSLDILHSVRAIYTEISFTSVREGSCSYRALREFLEANGFREVWKSSNGGRYADALFVKS